MERVESVHDEAEMASPGASRGAFQPKPLVTVRYWAAARKAAGAAEEKHAGDTVAEVLDAAVEAHGDSDRFARVLSVCSFLLGEDPLGTRDLNDVPVASGDVIDVLPPFAGG